MLFMHTWGASHVQENPMSTSRHGIVLTLMAMRDGVRRSHRDG